MKKRKVKRYNGEETSVVEAPDVTEESDSERRSKELLRQQGKAIRESVAPRRKIEDYIRQGDRSASPVSEGAEESKTFKQAFADARREGGKTFTWRGKKYTTELAGAQRSKRETPDESAAETARLTRAAAVRPPQEPGLETVSPESYFIGGPSLRAVKGAAEALAARQGAKAVSKRIEPHLSEMKDITPRATKRIGREPLKIGQEPLKLGMKKGGSVQKYASGGKVSSASKRADGIATKGKTRGRIC